MREAIEFVQGHGGGGAKVEGIVADVSSIRGMNELCDEVLARVDRLDCLVNNAGEHIHICLQQHLQWYHHEYVGSSVMVLGS